ncbi:MAG: pilQ [Gammaproteobacteria bacterium]|jgi:type IV pilus assembly protein PilQ|nr:pilQ [Gammaproteobacteria bacterium]
MFLINHKRILGVMLCIISSIYFLYAEAMGSLSKQISLELQEVSIQDALNILAKFMNINLIISPAIHGTTSLHLKKVFPEEAFNLLLLSHELSQWQLGHILYVMPRSEFLQEKQQELKLQTAVHEAEPLATHIWQIHYAKAQEIAHLLQEGNHTLLSARGHIYVDARTNIICVQDISDHLSHIHEFIQRLDIPVQQVLIEVHLASIDSDFERELGVSFAGQEPQVSEEADHLAESNYSPLSMHYGLAMIKLADGSLLSMRLSALERAGHGELISNPSLFTANQQTASIESGEEIPYQEVSQNGATGVTFKKAVLSLKVTPQIMPGNQVLLQLQVNQDKPSSRVILGVPAITTRKISTNILVKSGQTIVLGGIYESGKEHQQQRVPFLGKIPLVGLLFKQQNVANNKRELLIFVTPKVIS